MHLQVPNVLAPQELPGQRRRTRLAARAYHRCLLGFDLDTSTGSSTAHYSITQELNYSIITYTDNLGMVTSYENSHSSLCEAASPIQPQIHREDTFLEL